MRTSLGFFCLLLATACDPEEPADTAAPLAEEGESCAVEADCADGLVCLGEFAFKGEGWCVEDAMAGSFTATPKVAIPDASSVGVDSTITVSGLATVSVDVVVTLGISHDRPSDLSVTLTNPSGTTATVVSGEDVVSGEFVVRGIPSDEDANGDWTLSVTDPVRSQEGVLSLWQLYIISSYD